MANDYDFDFLDTSTTTNKFLIKTGIKPRALSRPPEKEKHRRTT
jgi:hypothetical protein